VIGNVLTNAAKVTPRGGAVTLTVVCEAGQAVIRVRDSGVGIDAAALDSVFDLFMQTGGTERTDGLGIGLTLAKSLIERHGVRIAVHSAGRHEGTEVTIALPMASPPHQTTPSSRRPAADAAIVPKRVLVVDDNRDAAEMVALLLKCLGHETRMAHDGQEAVDAAAGFRPHVVLLDLQLPRLDGYQAAEQIRRQDGSPPVLIALTGRGGDDDRRRSTAAGFTAYLVKPVDHNLLTKLIADLPAG
jgi:CheY-like chemotaxis protein/anti-sigma regulatory factor (Ser/Thr protein kinase)